MGVGPPGSMLASGSRGEEVGLPMSLGEGMVSGGGSMADGVGVDVGMTDSGRAGIGSSADEVSIAICTVFLMEGRWV